MTEDPRHNAMCTCVLKGADVARGTKGVICAFESYCLTLLLTSTCSNRRSDGRKHAKEGEGWQPGRDRGGEGKGRETRHPAGGGYDRKGSRKNGKGGGEGGQQSHNTTKQAVIGRHECHKGREDAKTEDRGRKGRKKLWKNFTLMKLMHLSRRARSAAAALAMLFSFDAYLV